MHERPGLESAMSAFIRYAELSSVKYDAKLDIIKVEIALNDGIQDEQKKGFLTRYTQCIRLYNNIVGVEPIYNNLKVIDNSDITILRLYRDGSTLTEEEIELFVGLVRQEFASFLIRDDNIMAAAVLSGDEKSNLLSKIRKSNDSYRNIFAYRDKGKVFVFNK